MIVGCKSDLEEQREVTTEEGREYAEANGFLFLETSAKLMTNVDKILPMICEKLAEDPCLYREEGKDDVKDVDVSGNRDKRC